MELERITPEQAGISGEKVKECIQKLMHDETQMHGFMAARRCSGPERDSAAVRILSGASFAFRFGAGAVNPL